MPSPTPTLLLFGGTGFVGTEILLQSLISLPYLRIIVVTRATEPPSWLCDDVRYDPSRVTYVLGDLLSPSPLLASLRSLSLNPTCAISCVGAITPWSQKTMVRTCGVANVTAYEISRKLGAEKFAVVTRDRSTNSWWYVQERSEHATSGSKRATSGAFWHDETRKQRVLERLASKCVHHSYRICPSLPLIYSRSSE